MTAADGDPGTATGDLAASSRDLAAMFASEPSRSVDMVRRACGIMLDVSRSHVSAGLAAAVEARASEVGVAGMFAAMTAGEVVNVTEDRPALHVAGRARPAFSFESRRAAAEMTRALALADETATSGRFDTVVNIGIGGSDLGPAMVTRALRRFRSGPAVRSQLQRQTVAPP